MNQNDINLLKDKGISISTINAQLSRFKNGFKPLNILRPATLEDGIVKLSKEQKNTFINIFTKEINNNLTLSKFVPASGAATRMFKDLYKYLENPQPINCLEDSHPITRFIDSLPKFAFFNLMQSKLKELNLNDENIRTEKAELIIKTLLNKEGLNYGFLPKGLIHFHLYENVIKTAMEEHLIEGSKFAVSKDNIVKIHFTISPEHHQLFNNKLKEETPFIENKFGVKLNVSFSFQKAHTDTLAVKPNNEPYRDKNGSLLFRPGGHGALIENLNEQDSEIIFIKNIDNVVPLHLLQTTIDYKKTLGGLLIELRNIIYSFLNQLEHEQSESLIQEIVTFIKKRLFATVASEFTYLDKDSKIKYLINYLNRPIRVCGMVRNEGEVGGGPFWIKEESGQESLQILEGSQINMNDINQVEQLKAATHFNPVDLVCSTYDYRGNKFDLTKYTDPETGFISEKSYNGQTLKALELPGLWNGAMANWVTLFVEVPIESFNPVKSVNDLLRIQHQPLK